MSRGNKTWTGVLALLVTCEFAGTLVYYAHLTSLKSVFDLSSKTSRTIEQTMNALYLVTDFVLAASLTLMLRKMRSGMDRTDSVINKITVYTISTSFVTVAIASE